MNNEGQDPLSILKRLAREIEDLKSYQITDELNNQATAQSNLQNSLSFGCYDSETERRKNFQSTFYRILNDDGDLSDMDKISQIIALKDSYSFFPFAFINLIREIKSNHYDLLDENKKEIVIFLKNYFQNPRVQLTSKFDGLSQSTDFVKNFFRIIRGYNYQIKHDLTSPPSPPPPPPPPPPPREKPVTLKFSSESLIPLPIFIGESNESSELGIAVTSQVVTNKADSQEVNQVSSAIIDDHNHQGVLFPLPKRLDPVDGRLLQFPKRLDLDGDQLPQQNIDSSPVVLSDQNQGVEANNLAMKASTASSQETFPMPRRLTSQDLSDVSSAIQIVFPVVADNTDSNATSSNAESESSSDSNKEKSGEDGQKTGCFGCVFFRVPHRITRCFSIIPSCILKSPFASCLGSSKSRVGPDLQTKVPKFSKNTRQAYGIITSP